MPDRRQGDRRNGSEYKRVNIPFSTIIYISIIVAIIIISIIVCSTLCKKYYNNGYEDGYIDATNVKYYEEIERGVRTIRNILT